MLSAITDTISLITVAQLILFSLFLLSTGKKRTQDKTALALFLFSNGIFILNFLGEEYRRQIIPFALNFLHVGSAFGFLFGPLLYIYTKAVTDKNFRFRTPQLIHTVPFLLSAVFFLWRYSFQSFARKTEILNTGLFNTTEMNIYTVCLNAVTFSYLFVCFLIVQERNKNLKTFYSSTEKINFDWLKLVVTAFALMWMTDLTNWLLSAFHLNTRGTRELLTFISLLINFVFANLLIFKNLSLPQLAYEDKNVVTKKYETSPLTEKEKQEILHRAEDLMKREKLYLESSLNLGEVAEKLAISQRYLSQVINELRKQNFYDFVNSYRIEEVKRLLLDPDYENDKIIVISLDSGFNSKSVFNTVFKKATGFTPSEFRKKYKNSAA